MFLGISTKLYLNGNYVSCWDGYTLRKRALRIGENFEPEFPDSIDLKVTNKCSWGCPFCHESSVPNGDTFDLEKTIEILSQLPTYPVEIAIGGGNVLDDGEKVKELISWLENRGNLTRVTINAKDLTERYDECVKYLGHVGGMGISLENIPKKLYNNWDGPSLYKSLLPESVDKSFASHISCGPTVFHIIAGVFPYKDLRKLFEISIQPILVLGYKQWGRAKGTDLPKDFQNFKDTIREIIVEFRSKGKYDKFISGRTIGFDNLALEQLEIKDLLSDTEWESLYMGHEGGHSMYIDAVKGEYAVTSRSDKRVSWDSIGLIDYFKNISRG